MSIAGVTSSIITPSTSSGATGTNTSANTSAGTTAQTDTATFSTAAQQASSGSVTSPSQFAAILHQLSSKLNAYEHQVTWQLDNKVAVTAPAGLTTSNTSTGTTSNTSTGTTSNTSTGTTSNTSTGTTSNTSTGTTSNTSTGTTSNTSSGTTSNTSSGTTSNTSTGTTSNTSTGTTSNTSTGTTSNASANSLTIAAGFASLESSFESQLTGLTADQQTQLDAANAKIATEQARFQTFVTNRTTPNYNNLTHELGSQINGYEHQVTWQIDNNTAVTAPPGTTTSQTSTSVNSNSSGGTATDASTSGTSNTSTGTTSTGSNTSTGTTTADTTAQTIANGFASLEASTLSALGTLSSAQTTQFQQLQQSFTTEESRFAAFIASRSAYRATQTGTGTNQDITA